MNKTHLDDNLIIRIAEGDAAAFRELYVLTSGAVYGFALSILGNREDAEDIMHDAYIKIHNNASLYRPSGSPLAWILTIVRNLAYNRLKTSRRSEDLSSYENILLSENHDTHEQVTDRMIINQFLSVLDTEERQIVILHAHEGMKHREIAEILDMPVGTVLSKYNRAIRKMRKNRDIFTGKGRRDEQES